MNGVCTIRYLKMEERYPLMYGKGVPLGFGCPQGWSMILERLSKEIERILAEESQEFRDRWRVVQVKEKFGGLRFYYDGGNEQIARLVSRAESESRNTCQDCASTPAGHDNWKKSGWLHTVCVDCGAE